MIKLQEFIDETKDIDSEDVDVVIEKLIRKKIIRNGKLKKVKRSNRDGFTSKNGVEKKMDMSDRIKRSKTQKLASIKRKSKKNIANTKRKKSNKIRKSMGL